MPIQTINDSTFKLTAKNDPKDLITVIIGDDKQEKFYPQIKLERWDNEVNFSVRLKDNIGGVVKTKGDKITYSKGNSGDISLTAAGSWHDGSVSGDITAVDYYPVVNNNVTSGNFRIYYDSGTEGYAIFDAATFRSWPNPIVSPYLEGHN